MNISVETLEDYALLIHKNSVMKLEMKNNYYFIYPNKLDHLIKIDKELTDIMYSIDKFSPAYEKK